MPRNLFAKKKVESAPSYLDVTAPPVEVEVQVLNLAVLAKGVVDCLLVDLLVQVCHDDDPALYGAHGGCLGVRHHVVDLCLGGLGRAGLVDVHLHVGHDCLVPCLFADGEALAEFEFEVEKPNWWGVWSAKGGCGRLAKQWICVSSLAGRLAEACEPQSTNKFLVVVLPQPTAEQIPVRLDGGQSNVEAVATSYTFCTHTHIMRYCVSKVYDKLFALSIYMCRLFGKRKACFTGF